MDEAPLQVVPRLAKALGLNQAIILQQMHYWLGKSEKIRDGYKWTYHSYADWEAQFPFWNLSTIRRAIKGLETQGILVTANYNRMKADQTKWYRIDYEAFDKAVKKAEMENTEKEQAKQETQAEKEQSRGMNKPCGQNEQMDCSKRTNGTVQNEQTNTIDYTETTTRDSNSNNRAPENHESKIPSDKTEKPEVNDRQELFNFWEQNGFGMIPPILFENIDKYLDDFTEAGATETDAYAVMKFALNEAVEAGQRRWNYVAGILNNYLGQRILSVQQAISAKAEWQQKKQGNYKKQRPSPARESIKERLAKSGKESGNLPF